LNKGRVMRFSGFFSSGKPVCLAVLCFAVFFTACLGQTAAYEYSPAAEPEISSAERIMTALAAAYPNRISPAEYRDGDWAFLLDGRWFFYAERRILPEELLYRINAYTPMRFNQNYLENLPPWEEVQAAWVERTRRQEEARASGQLPVRDGRPRPQHFLEALWESPNRNEALSQQVTVEFLGFGLRIHSGIAGKIKRVEEIILTEAQTNPELRQWIASLGSIAGWNWRNIGGSQNRSLHSYGIAIDILPRNLNGLATYWAWSEQWWDIPFTGRWNPPDEVIYAFESFGFVWGGKWLHHFDTMHFEYRPEVFILSGVPMSNF